MVIKAVHGLGADYFNKLGRCDFLIVSKEIIEGFKHILKIRTIKLIDLEMFGMFRMLFGLTLGAIKYLPIVKVMGSASVAKPDHLKVVLWVFAETCL